MTMTEINKEVKNKIKHYTEINEPDFITFLVFDINCLKELYTEGTITHFSDDILRIANHFECMGYEITVLQTHDLHRIICKKKSVVRKMIETYLFPTIY